MNTADDNQHKSIEVDNQTFIIDEIQALRIFHAMKQEFGWVGTVFIEDDVKESIADRRAADDKEPYTLEQMDEAVVAVMNSSGWNKWMEASMCEQGYECLGLIIWDEVEHFEKKFN